MMTINVWAVLETVGLWVMSAGLVFGLVGIGLKSRKKLATDLTVWTVVLLAVIGLATLLHLAWG